MKKQKHGKFDAFMKAQDDAQVVCEVAGLAPPVLKSEERILSRGVDMLHRCPPAQFLCLLTLVPDI